MGYTYSFRKQEIKERNLDELIGISKGLLADNIVNKSEAKFLLHWIENHFNEKEIKEYPQNIIFDRLKNMLSDNILDKTESKELVKLLKKFIGGKPISEQVKSMSSILPLCQPFPNVIIKDKKFCMTGIFTIGSREQCSNIIKNLSGSISKTLTFDVDYLIIGILGNDEWKHSTYGRKIERAIKIRDEKKSDIHIISEEHFIKFI